MPTNLLGVAPINMADTATEIAGYLPAAAGAGLTLFAVWFGVVMIKRVFQIAA